MDKLQGISNNIDSPLKPYRNIIENNPIEDHFTNKYLKKHIRHLGLIPIEDNNAETSSLAQDQHKFDNSEKQKLKRFKQNFILTMVDNIQEIDQARQAEFREQLHLWDKIYSNRIQRLKTYDTHIQRKYGLFIDRQLKKELIRENLSKMPSLPSLSIPKITQDHLPRSHRRRKKFVKISRASPAPSSRSIIIPQENNFDQLNERLTQLEQGFLSFKKEDFNNCRNDVNQIETNIEELIDKQNSIENKINDQIEKFKIDLNKFIEQQKLIKIEQKKQRKDILKYLSNNSKEINYQDFLNLKEIIDQHDKLIQQLKKDKIEIIEKEFNQFKNNYLINIQTIINQNLNQTKTFINQQINDIKQQIKDIQDKIKDLQNKIKIEPIKKQNNLPYLEKIPPKDLFEINWQKL